MDTTYIVFAVALSVLLGLAFEARTIPATDLFPSVRRAGLAVGVAAVLALVATLVALSATVDSVVSL